MRRDDVDFFLVEEHQLGIHARLLNWERWVVTRIGRNEAPIWRLGRSNSRQWHSPEPHAGVDLLDAVLLEKAVAALPDKHRDAIRWCYVWRSGPAKARRALAVTNEGLLRLIRDGRQMLLNRI